MVKNIERFNENNEIIKSLRENRPIKTKTIKATENNEYETKGAQDGWDKGYKVSDTQAEIMANYSQGNYSQF